LKLIFLLGQISFNTSINLDYHHTRQSYSTFSVGGTISVNAHGITSDHCLAESVVHFTIILANGQEKLCSRDSVDETAKELFLCAIGGYGLFGIITEVFRLCLYSMPM
jgi:FAD/FMN-containing dehydrogenase